MLNEFSRTELLLGQDGMKKLKSSSVAIFGVGGVGSYIAEALARSGVGKLILIDNDEVTITNLNRQLIALHSTIGRKKVDVAKDRLLDINPQATVEALDCFYTGSEIDLSGFDYIADAIDTVSSKPVSYTHLLPLGFIVPKAVVDGIKAWGRRIRVRATITRVSLRVPFLKSLNGVSLCEINGPIPTISGSNFLINSRSSARLS